MTVTSTAKKEEEKNPPTTSLITSFFFPHGFPAPDRPRPKTFHQREISGLFLSFYFLSLSHSAYFCPSSESGEGSHRPRRKPLDMAAYAAVVAILAAALWTHNILTATQRIGEVSWSSGRAVGPWTGDEPNGRNKTDGQMARDNVLRNSNAVRCALPKPKVIKVQSVHPHASKRFVPSCVILHRCNKDTGCCDDQLSTCSAYRRQRITLYFYVVTMDVHNGSPSVTSDGKVEPLTFVNHTACKCKRRKIRGQKIPLSKESTVSRANGFVFRVKSVGLYIATVVFLLNSLR